MKRQNKDVWNTEREKKRKIKRFIYQNKKKINEQLGRKVNEDVNKNSNCFGGGE